MNSYAQEECSIKGIKSTGSSYIRSLNLQIQIETIRRKYYDTIMNFPIFI
jgi:hypothetical protein